MPKDIPSVSPKRELLKGKAKALDSADGKRGGPAMGERFFIERNK